MAARETALCCLIACRKDGAWSNSVLKEYIRRDRLDRRDAALCARLCYGVLQNRGKLDFYLKQLLTGRIKNLHPVVHDILHLGLYQLYEMDKIPESAAVNESVSLAKKYCKALRSASGLVNAVLRNAIRSKGQLRQPTNLSDRFSHPQKLIDLLKSYVGAERLEKMLEANNTAPDTVVQVNTLRTTTQALIERLSADGISVKNHSWMPDCLILSGTGDLEQLPAFREGLFYVQDCAARMSVLCAQIPEHKPMHILDACSAPGGKSFAAAICNKNEGNVYSCDIHPHKLQLIKNGADRLGLECIETHLQDGTKPNPEWVGKMDLVIADVPCSGFGIIRKKPDIRYKDPDSMKDLPALQFEILQQQAEYVKPGGILIYSTCTLVKAENEDVVNAFLQKQGDFVTEPLPLPAPLPKNSNGMYCFVPGEFETDGFFICRLRRKL